MDTNEVKSGQLTSTPQVRGVKNRGNEEPDHTPAVPDSVGRNTWTNLRSNSVLGGVDLGVTATEGVSRLLDKVGEYLPVHASALIKDAYHFADRSHEGQMRKSGEPYIAHPLEIALFLAELRLDEQTIAASLLHDVVEDCGVFPG